MGELEQNTPELVGTCQHCSAALTRGSRFCPLCGTPVNRAQLLVGDYELVELIAEGGMGRVYRAVQRRLRRSVCIKTLLPMLAVDPVVVRRFEQEAITTATLNHPNVVSVYDVGRTSDGVPYIVMEFVEGRTLAALIAEEAPVPVEHAVGLIDQVLSGLSAAHRHRIIHRDLKPGNVLVATLEDGSALCKVVDFGIARLIEDSGEGARLTKSGVILGTPGYMAPEQILNQSIDHRADLYAVGVLLYQLITGQRVFTGTDTEVLRKAVMDEPLPPSRRVSQSIPDALDAVCLKALARDRDTRYFTAAEFREALAQVAIPRTFISRPSASDYLALATEVVDAPPGAGLGPAGSAVIGATDELERARLLEPVERALAESVSTANVDLLRSLIAAMQREHRERGASAALHSLAGVLKHSITAQLPRLCALLADPESRSRAQWVLRLLGPRGVRSLVDALPDCTTPESRAALLSVLHELDPEGTAIGAALREVSPAASATMLTHVREWPVPCVAAWFSMLLHSPDSTQRLHGLSSLDEPTAIQLEGLVRQRLHDPVSAVRQGALGWVLRLADENAIDDLIRLLGRQALPAMERRSVLRALARFSSAEAIAALVGALESSRDPEEAAELAFLLVRTGSPAALASLVELGTRSPGRLKRAVDEALKER